MRRQAVDGSMPMAANRFILLLGDAWLAVDHEIMLLGGPLVPAGEPLRKRGHGRQLGQFVVGHPVAIGQAIRSA